MTDAAHVPMTQQSADFFTRITDYLKRHIDAELGYPVTRHDDPELSAQLETIVHALDLLAARARELAEEEPE